LVAGQQLGAFDNLSMSTTDINGGAEALPLVSSGDLQGVTEVSEPPLTIAQARGIPMKIVWMGNTIPTQMLVSSAITDPKELEGKKLAAPSGSVAQTQLLTYIESIGLTFDDIEYVDMGAPEAVSAFKSGAIDGALSFPPFSTAIIEDGGQVLEEYGARNVEAFATSFVEEHPEVVQAFVCDFASVQERALEDPNEAWTAISEALKIPKDGLKTELPQESITPIDEMTNEKYMGPNGIFVREIVNSGKALKKLGQVETEPTIEEANDMLDLSFVEAVQNGEC
jgi:sulfonate transport system substrate-binding protein